MNSKLGSKPELASYAYVCEAWNIGTTKSNTKAVTALQQTAYEIRAQHDSRTKDQHSSLGHGQQQDGQHAQSQMAWSMITM